MGQISSTHHLVCTWRVEMKREKSIKGEGNNESGDWNFVRENTVAA